MRINYREEAKRELTFRFRFHSDDNAVTKLEPMTTLEGAFLAHFGFPHAFRKLDIDVYDADGGLIDFYRPTDVVNLLGDPTKACAKLG